MTARNLEPRDKRGRPVWTYPLLGCLLFLGASAVYGGLSLVLDPTGRTLGLPFEWIEGTVFGDYLVPGVVLLAVLGGGSFVVAYGVLRRTRWAWPAGAALGTATVVWILVQVATVRQYFFLQPIVAGLGVAIVALLMLPSMQRCYRTSDPSQAIVGRGED
jgi:hypothetical protein